MCRFTTCNWLRNLSLHKLFQVCCVSMAIFFKYTDVAKDMLLPYAHMKKLSGPILLKKLWNFLSTDPVEALTFLTNDIVVLFRYHGSPFSSLPQSTGWPQLRSVMICRHGNNNSVFSRSNDVVVGFHRTAVYSLPHFISCFLTFAYLL